MTTTTLAVTPERAAYEQKQAAYVIHVRDCRRECRTPSAERYWCDRGQRLMDDADAAGDRIAPR